MAQRVARAAYNHLGAAALEFPLDPSDAADSARLELARPNDFVPRGRRLRVGWVCTPPSLGSGGHTTMFRMVNALEAAGHDCTLFLYDRYRGDVREHAAQVRLGWPDIKARVRDAADGITHVDACVATSWPTAHVLARRGTAPMRRLYFVQDYEPFFYPRGAEYTLAEDTYRFGFRCITIGHMLARLLRDDFGIAADVVEFGCDLDVYRLTATQPRRGVVFYAKPYSARRGFQVGVLALAEVRRRRPDVPIHTVGHPGIQLPFPAINHGVLRPQELAALYNEAVAGVALSYTNISLLVEEFLACGAVPVINESFDFRADAPSPFVRWAPPTQSGIAEELLAVLDDPPDPSAVAVTAAGEGWQPAQAAFLRAVEDETYGPAVRGLHGAAAESRH